MRDSARNWGRIGDRRAGGSDAERGNVDRADRFHIRREDAKRETARWRVTRASVFASALSPEWRAPVSDDVPSTTASRSFARLGARRREGRWRGIMRRSLSAVARRLRGASDASRSPTRVAALADASSAVAISQPWRALARFLATEASARPPSPRSPSRTPFPTSTPPSVASFTPTAPATSPRRPSASSASTSSVAPSVARAPRRIPPRSRRSPPRTTTSASSSTSTPRDSLGTRRHPKAPSRRRKPSRDSSTTPPSSSPASTRGSGRRRRPRRLPVFAPRRPRGDGVEKPPRRARRESNSRPRSRSASRPRPSDGARLLQPRGGFRIGTRGCGDWRRRSGSPWRRTPRRSAAIGARTRSIRARSRTPRTTPSCRSGSRGDNTRGTLRVTCRSPIGPRVSRDVRDPRISTRAPPASPRRSSRRRRRCGRNFDGSRTVVEPRARRARRRIGSYGSRRPSRDTTREAATRRGRRR